MLPLTSFESRVSGRNARVAIYPDRIEWSQPGRTTVANVLLVILAIYTAAISLLFPAARPRFKERGRHILAMKAVQSVSSRYDGMFTAVAVVAGASSIEFRVPHSEAPGIEALVRDLMLGRHPAASQ
jgi:hypothetical protein